MISQKTTQTLMLFLAIFLSFSLPLSRAGINLAGFALFIVWILEGDFKKKFLQLLTNPFTFSLWLFLIYQILVYLWVEPDNLKEAISYTFKYVYFLIIFVLYTSFDVSKVRYLLYAFLAGMFISVLQSFSVYFDIYHFHEINAKSLSIHMWHTIYSIFLAFSALLSLLFMITTKRTILKLLFILLFFFTSAVLFLGISRTGQVLYIFGLFVLMIKYLGLRGKHIFFALLFTALVFGMLYQQNRLFKSRIDVAKEDIVLLLNKDYCTSLGGRVFTWKVATEVFQHSPILGLGTIDHTDYLLKAMEDDVAFSKCAIKNLIGYYHSQFIELTAQSGMIGLFLLLYIFYTLFRTPINDPLISAMKTIFIVIFFFSFIVDVPFRKMFTLALFSIISSVILLQSKKETPT